MLKQTGWTLALAGFASAIWLDPWALERDAYVSFPFRQAQTAVLTMAFFLFTLLQASRRNSGGSPIAARLVVAGAILYVGGWACAAWFTATPLAALGAILAGAGCAIFAARSEQKTVVQAALWTMNGGCFLLAITALWTLIPALRPIYIGAEDGLRLRLLRLAQVAAFALPSLVLLISNDGIQKEKDEKWRRVMAWGAAGMPGILTMAALTTTAFKYLLPLPAFAVFSASAWAAWQAKHETKPSLRLVGWLVIAGSMGVGLFMGLYAFNGPVTAPPHFADYNELARRLSRLGHAYLILVGLLALFIAGERSEHQSPTNRRLFYFIVSGMLTTFVASVGAAAHWLPTGALCVGPVLVTTALCLHRLRPERKAL